MAIFYGRESEFIKGKQATRRNKLIGLLVFFLIVAIILLIYARHYWYVSPLALLLGVAVSKDLIADTFREIGSDFRFWFRKKGQADRGMLGERIVKQALEQLPDTYSVYRGFRPNQRNDIDFIVVGPNGLFALEAKSQTGKLTFEKRSYGNRLLWQARKEALELYKYFAEGWKIKVYVTGILVFARSGAKIPDMEQPRNNVYIVKADQLVQTIINHRGFLRDREAITTRLKFFYQT